jgi:hypothetical protein
VEVERDAVVVAVEVVVVSRHRAVASCLLPPPPPPPRARVGNSADATRRHRTDEFHESEGVVYIPGVRGGEWVVPGPFPSWADSKRTTIFRELISIRLEKNPSGTGRSEPHSEETEQGLKENTTYRIQRVVAASSRP